MVSPALSVPLPGWSSTNSIRHKEISETDFDQIKADSEKGANEYDNTAKRDVPAQG